MSGSDWMIYGANGYTGKLIAEECARRGLKPILAGRSPEVAELAKRLGLPHRLFSLGDADGTAAHLEGIGAVLHCAGPFSRTSRAMADACLRARAHYLDITGEIGVFEAIHARSAEFERAGITAIPGSGFDVVPSDCLAAMLKRKLPSADQLMLTLLPLGKTSPGTARTMLEGAGQGNKVRRDGRIQTVPTAAKRRTVTIDGRRFGAVLIPWGDVSTAYYSTGIPNIETYMAQPAWSVPGFKLMAALARLGAVQRAGSALIGRFVHGPGPEERARSSARIHGEVRDARGGSATMVLKTPDGYSHTVDAAIACVTRLMQGGVRAGALTPSMAFGPDFVLSLPGVRLTEA